MAQANKSSGIPHEDRTATEPRSHDLHDVTVDKIDEVNDSIKLYKLKINNAQTGIKFLPGQWLDVFVPGITKAGGFTITSTPRCALASSAPQSEHGKSHNGEHIPYLELAIQHSPDNPPAAWLWQKPSAILDQTLNVRVGGSFTWPPRGWSTERAKSITKVIFVAGGVGINPLISMISSMFDGSSAHVPPKISFLYSTKYPGISAPEDKDWLKLNPKDKKKWYKHESKILFLPRLLDLAERHPRIDLTLFLTGTSATEKIMNPESLGWYHDRRLEEQDLLHALGDDMKQREKTIVYVCGPPAMTDGLVAWFVKQERMEAGRVLCEKWW